MKLRDIILTSAATTLLVLVPGQVLARSLDLIFEDRIVEIDEYRIDGRRYVSLSQLMSAVGGILEWDELHRALRIMLSGQEWVLWSNSAIISIDGEARTLGSPVVLEDGEPAAPLEAIAELLDHYTDARVYLRGRDLKIESQGGTVFRYSIDERRNGVIIKLAMSDIVPYEEVISEGNWINLTLLAARLQPERLNAWRPHHAVREVRAAQFENSAQISFRMRNPVDKYLITEDHVEKTLTLLVGDTSFMMRTEAVAPPHLDVGSRFGPIDLIAIDAGHGGHDTGAVGLQRDIAEKDITLAIAKRVVKRFQKNRDISVILSHEDDVYQSDRERARRANEANADLFISIHANSSENTTSRGCQTFFLGRAHNEHARALSEFENAAGESAIDSTIESDSVASIQREINCDFQSASADLAELIQRQFEATLDIPSRGVDQAEFDLLNHLNMPGVMVFAAFITNTDDEELLRRRSFQSNVAKAIYEGVLAYCEKLERAHSARTDR